MNWGVLGASQEEVNRGVRFQPGGKSLIGEVKVCLGHGTGK